MCIDRVVAAIMNEDSGSVHAIKEMKLIPLYALIIKQFI